jgi:hypothetical protein
MEARRLRSRIRELQAENAIEVAVPAAPSGGETPAASSAEELIAIRAEIASLRRLIEERFRAIEGASQAAARVASAQPANPNGPGIPGYIRNGWVDRSGIPAAVLEGFRLQLGDVPVEGAHMKQADGRVFYYMESKTQDGRGMELALDEKGQVVMRRVDMELGGLSDSMQGNGQGLQQRGIGQCESGRQPVTIGGRYFHQPGHGTVEVRVATGRSEIAHPGAEVVASGATMAAMTAGHRRINGHLVTGCQ